MRLLLITFLFIATSCSTLTTRRSYTVKVFSAGSHGKLEVSGETYALPADIQVKRSKENLHLRLHSDSAMTDFQVKATTHGKFKFGNLIWPPAYLIDLTNPKRFHYGEGILLDMRTAPYVTRLKMKTDVNDSVPKEFSRQKGQLKLVVSLPYVNSFYLKPDGEPAKSNTGFWGFSTGLEYYYTKKRFIALTGSCGADIFMPFPAPIDYEGYHESMSSIYVNATHNHQLKKRFYVGYGLTFATNLWTWSDDSPQDPTLPPMPPPPGYGRKVSHALGLNLNGYYQFSEHFLLGLIYRPTILRVSPVTEFKYEHLISIDLAWRYVLRKGDDK